MENAPIATVRIGISEIRRLTSAVKEAHGFDFSNYALSSFRRRLERFLRFQRINSMNRLIERVVSEPDFFHFFLEEITVNVTEMFRDAAFWRELRKVMTTKLDGRYRTRIWHAGCSSGEEVYSMLIMLDQLNMLDKCRITATDINERVLTTAKLGVIDPKKMDLNCKNYTSFQGEGTLQSYFTKKYDTYTLRPELLRKVTFQEHDLARHAAPGEFDLILCRNVLIYFNKDLQNQVLGRFTQSLRKGGYLAIGSMESLDGTPVRTEYATDDYQENIFRKLTA